jgi:phosphoribosylformylglycinamidine synthase
VVDEARSPIRAVHVCEVISEAVLTMVKAEIRIGLKHGVADPEGENTRKALELLGFKGVQSVKTIKVFEMELNMDADQARAACDEMCRKLLANPVIQIYSIELK